MKDVARSLFLVCYDVSSPKRLRQVHKFLLGYKVGGQKSFFECWLTPTDLREVQKGLEERMDLNKDRAHLFQLDPRMAVTGLGVANPKISPPFLII